MWAEMTLSLPASPAPVICQEMAIHPWDVMHGHTTPDGCYLSPANALSALSVHMRDASQDVIVIMVCAGDIADFAGKLEPLAAVLPLPELSRVARRARTQITQAVARMQIPSTPSPGMSPAAPLMVSTLQQAVSNRQAIQAIAAEGAGELSAIKSALKGFQQQRQAMQQQIAADLAATTASAVNVSAFIHPAGSDTPSSSAVMKDIPHPASSLTYAHMFTGNLSGMLTWFSEVK